MNWSSAFVEIFPSGAVLFRDGWRIDEESLVQAIALNPYLKHEIISACCHGVRVGSA